MNKIIWKNILMNLISMAIFVILNNWAVKNGLEETFVSLAVIYGVIIVITNGFFIKFIFRQR